VAAAQQQQQDPEQGTNQDSRTLQLRPCQWLCHTSKQQGSIASSYAGSAPPALPGSLSSAVSALKWRPRRRRRWLTPLAAQLLQKGVRGMTPIPREVQLQGRDPQHDCNLQEVHKVPLRDLPSLRFHLPTQALKRSRRTSTGWSCVWRSVGVAAFGCLCLACLCWWPLHQQQRVVDMMVRTAHAAGWRVTAVAHARNTALLLLACAVYTTHPQHITVGQRQTRL
jgi:hypothetical protein